MKKRLAEIIIISIVLIALGYGLEDWIVFLIVILEIAFHATTTNLQNKIDEQKVYMKGLKEGIRIKQFLSLFN